MIVKLQPSRDTFSNFALLNSDVTAPIFTKNSNDVEALAQLLIRTFTKQCCFLSGNARAKSEDGQFDVCKKAPKFIRYYGNVHYRKIYFSFIIIIHLSTSTEIVVAINLVHAEIFGTKCQFLPFCPKRCSFYRATAMLSAVYAVVVCLSVCPSVCLCVCVRVCYTPALYQNG